MTSFIDIDVSNIMINLLYIVSYIQNLFTNIYECIINCSNKFYEKYFDKQIISIYYLDNYRNYYNIYSIYFNFLFLIKCFCGIRIDICKRKELIEIFNIVQIGSEGLIIINYFNNQHKKIIINLQLFKNDGCVTIYDVNSLIENFIIYDVKNDIVCVELDNTDITEQFLKYKNSYKLDNLKYEDIIYCINVIYNKNYNEHSNIKITDDDLNENVYRFDKYINL